jgi:hypothetical protein
MTTTESSSKAEQSTDSSKTPSTVTSKEQTNGSSAEKQNRPSSENNKKTATHLEEASNHLQEATKFHEVGDHKKAKESVIRAQSSVGLASKSHQESSEQTEISDSSKSTSPTTNSSVR